MGIKTKSDHFIQGKYDNFKINEIFELIHFCYIVILYMIIEIIISLLIFAAIYCVYKFIIKPKQEYEWYRKNLEKLGYKVYVYPFHPFKSPLMEERMQNQKENGDPYYQIKKNTIYQDYDLALSNKLSKINIQIFNPDLIQEFFNPNNKINFIKAQEFLVQAIRYLGKGIVFDEGKDWKRKKKILTEVFNHDFIKSQTPKIEKICEKSMNFIEQKYKTEKQGEYEFKLIQLTQLIFSTVIAECFFGQSVSDERIQGQTVSVYLSNLILGIGKLKLDYSLFFFSVDFIKYGVKKEHRDINQKIQIFRDWGLKFVKSKIDKTEKNIEEIRKKTERDIIQIFVLDDWYCHENQKKGDNKYDINQIFEEFMNLYVAGSETTSHFTQIMIYQSLKNPRIQEKLRQQISENMKEDNYSFENLKNFPYIRLLQKETGRFYGPTNSLFPRVATEDYYLKDIPMKKGTFVYPRFNPNLFSNEYFDNPLEFNPERFEDEDKEQHPYVLVNFSAGARTCIGKHLALLESKLALIKIMKRYKTMIPPSEPLKFKFGLTVGAEVYVKVKKH